VRTCGRTLLSVACTTKRGCVASVTVVLFVAVREVGSRNAQCHTIGLQDCGERCLRCRGGTSADKDPRILGAGWWAQAVAREDHPPDGAPGWSWQYASRALLPVTKTGASVPFCSANAMGSTVPSPRSISAMVCTVGGRSSPCNCGRRCSRRGLVCVRHIHEQRCCDTSWKQHRNTVTL